MYEDTFNVRSCVLGRAALPRPRGRDDGSADADGIVHVTASADVLAVGNRLFRQFRERLKYSDNDIRKERPSGPGHHDRSNERKDDVDPRPRALPKETSV